MVHRGTTVKTAPRQPLTVKCPVKHCGESLDVAWCKLLNTNRCEQINETGNVEILQDEMISSLIFKRISIYDDGLYRCYLKGSKYVAFSHIINISVSGRQFFLPQSQNIDIKCLVLSVNCKFFLSIYRLTPWG